MNFELIARRDDVEQREYPIGYRFRPTRDGVVWVVQDIERDNDTIRHVCRLESAEPGGPDVTSHEST